MSEQQPRYFDIVDDGRYVTTVKHVKNMAELSENFLTEDEIKERFNVQYIGYYNTRFVNRNLISAHVEKLVEQLNDPKVRSVPINDAELLEILKLEGVANFAEGVSRRGDRLTRYKYRKRKQTKVRQKDISTLWGALARAVRDEVGFWSVHVPRRDRSAGLLKIFKRAIAWKHVVKHIDKDQRRWCRMVWQKPEEYL